MSDVKGLLSAGVIIFIVICFIYIGLTANHAKELSECETQSGVEFTIIDKDKDTRTVYTGKGFINTTTYYLVLELEEGFTHKLVCTAAEYNSLNIGNSVLCTIYYNANKEIMKISLIS